MKEEHFTNIISSPCTSTSSTTAVIGNPIWYIDDTEYTSALPTVRTYAAYSGTNTCDDILLELLDPDGN